MAEVAGLTVRISGDATGLKKQIRDVKEEISKLGATGGNTKALETQLKSLQTELKKVESSSVSLQKQLRGVQANLKDTFGVTAMNMSKKAVTGIAGIATSLTALGTAAMAEAGKLQSTQIAFTNLLGSAEKAGEYIRELQDFAKQTPFTFEDLTIGAQRFMAMGFAAEEVIPTLRAVGDAAAGVGMGAEGINRVSLALGQMKAKGTVQSEEMRQLAEAGIPAWDMLAKKLNTDVATAMKMVENRTVDANTGIAALVEGMQSKYGGIMEKQASSIQGSFAIMSDGVKQSLAQIGVAIDENLNISGRMKETGQAVSDFARIVQDEGLKKAISEFIPSGTMAALAGFATLLTASAIPAVISFGASAAAAMAGIVTAAGPVGIAIAGLVALFVNAYAEAQNTESAIYRLGDAMGDATDDADGLANALARVKANWITSGTSDDWDLGSGVDLYGALDEALGTSSTPATPTTSATTTLGTGGGGGGSSSAAQRLTEEERAVDALIQKYADASAQARLRGEVANQTAGLLASMLTGEAKQREELALKLDTLQSKHEAVIEGYEKELTLAQQISDSDTRERTIEEIQAQIDAQNELYAAQVKSANLESLQAKSKEIISKAMAENQKSIMEMLIGDPEDTQTKIDQNLQMLQNFMDEVNAIEAGGQGSFTSDDLTGGENGEGLSEESQGFLMKMLKTSPEALEAEFEEKQEAFSSFADFIEQKMAEATAAENQNLKVGEQWKNKQNEWITSIGKSMGSAVASWITGSKSIGKAMQDMVKSLIQQAIELMVEWLAVFAVLSIMGSKKAAAAGATKAVLGIDPKNPVGKATGGYISGPGTGTSDDIPMMLSNGEYVIRASAVDQLGIPFLNALNSGNLPIGRADGGAVGGLSIRRRSFDFSSLSDALESNVARFFSGSESSSGGESVSAVMYNYGDINTGSDLEDLMSEFSGALAAGLRGV